MPYADNKTLFSVKYKYTTKALRVLSRLIIGAFFTSFYVMLFII